MQFYTFIIKEAVIHISHGKIHCLDLKPLDIEHHNEKISEPACDYFDLVVLAKINSIMKKS